MQPLVSVIVPIYNVDAYLPQCINSIISQTYPNLEVILIDDGSTDNCGKICDEYSSQHDNIKVIHKSNGGLSSARNAGIDIASGEYISFVDSDDWILPHHIEALYENVFRNNVLLSICQSQRVHDFKDSDNIPTKTGCEIMEKEAVMHEALTKYKWWSAWDKIYHRSLFETIRFPIGRINEDYAIIFNIFDLCDRIAVGNQITYCYFERIGSITKSGFNESKFTEYTNGLEVLEFMKSKYPALTAPAENILITTCLKLLSCISNEDNNMYEDWRSKILNTIRHSFGSWTRNPYVLTKQKILLFPACVNYKLFSLIMRIYRKIWN